MEILNQFDMISQAIELKKLPEVNEDTPKIESPRYISNWIW